MKEIAVSWATMKSFVDIRGVSPQFVDEGGIYNIRAADDYFLLATVIIKDSGTDQVDFETNYLSKSNKTLIPKDLESSALIRNKVSPIGWTYQHHSFEFSTSTIGSLNHKKFDLTDFGFCTLKFYKDESGTECTDQTDADSTCIKTVIDWEPTHDFELIGGVANWESVLNSEVFLWVVGVPNIPYAYGGTKEMISNCSLKHFLNREIGIDGRATKRLNYSASYHTNKLRFIFRHPAGFKFNPQINMEFYKL